MSTKRLQEVKVFGLWKTDEIEVEDPGLKRYISVRPVLLPHTAGRQEHQRFRKSTVNISERLANNIMRHGKVGGKKAKALGIVRNALQIVALRTGKNPIEVLVRGLENSAPCEGVTRIAYGGIVYPISVDIAPQRRVDLALRNIAEGAREAARSNPRTIDETLADEIVAAAERDAKSFAVRKRDEMERIALSSR